MLVTHNYNNFYFSIKFYFIYLLVYRLEKEKGNSLEDVEERKSYQLS